MTDASPLSVASPDALTAMFEADPTSLSDAQLMVLVTELRRRRNVFTSEEAAKALKPKTTRAKAEPQSAAASAALDIPPSELSLDDL